MCTPIPMPVRYHSKKDRAKLFCDQVAEIAKMYEVSFFVVSEGASAHSNYNCEAIRNACESHAIWERENLKETLE